MPGENGNYGAVEINLNGLFFGAQAETMNILGKNAVAQQARMQGILDVKLDEVGSKEALASRMLLTGVPNETTAMAGR